MVKVTNWLTRHRRHKRFIARAKWFSLWRWTVYNQVRSALIKQWQRAYVWRKLKKRDFRKLWIERINAAVRAKWSRYSVFMGQLAKKDVALNRKMLSNIALVFPQVFDKIFDHVSE